MSIVYKQTLLLNISQIWTSEVGEGGREYCEKTWGFVVCEQKNSVQQISRSFEFEVLTAKG